MERLRGGQRQQRVERALLIGRRVTERLRLDRRDRVLERIAIDALFANRHQAERLQARQRRAGDAALGQHRRRQPVGGALQQVKRLDLPLAEPGGHARRGFRAVRGQAFGGVSARGGQRRDADGLESIGARGQSVRRQRRGQRGAGPGQVVLRHPLGQLHDVGRHERVVVEHLLDRLDRVGGVGGGRLAEHHAGQRARADRHDDARAGARHVVLGGHAIREDAERGHGHRDGHQSSRGLRIADCGLPYASDCRIARTFFMSSHTSRFADGLRSR